MDTIIFSGGGFLLILFALFLIRKHKHFMSSSIEVPGEIIDIVERLFVIRGSLGGVSEKRTRQLPIVKYRYSKLYQFVSDKDVTQDGVKIGSQVVVRIDPLRPKVAKLAIGLSDNSMFFKIMIGLGVFLIIIGAVQYKPSDFNWSLFDDWLALSFLSVGAVYLYIKLSPVFSLLKHNPLYMENAKEFVVKQKDELG